MGCVSPPYWCVCFCVWYVYVPSTLVSECVWGGVPSILVWCVFEVCVLSVLVWCLYVGVGGGVHPLHISVVSVCKMCVWGVYGLCIPALSLLIKLAKSVTSFLPFNSLVGGESKPDLRPLHNHSV